MSCARYPQAPHRLSTPESPGCAYGCPQPPCAQLEPMNDTDVIRTEVADRLRGIGQLGDHLAADEIDLDLAIKTATGLLERAVEWKDSTR